MGVEVPTEGARERGAACPPPRVVGESLETHSASRAISFRPQTLSEGGYGGGRVIDGVLTHAAVSPARAPARRRGRV